MNLYSQVFPLLRLSVPLFLLLPVTVTESREVTETVSDMSPLIEYQFDSQENVLQRQIINQSSTNYVGIISGSASLIPGVSGTAIQMDGVDTYISISGSESLDVSTNGFTLEAWVNRFSNASEDAVISKWYGEDQFLLTFYPDGNGRLVFSVKFADGMYGSIEYFLPDTSYLQRWMKISAIYTPSLHRSKLQLFLDGRIVAGRFFRSTGISSGGVPIHIGDANNTWSRFHGQIDDVKIWTNPLLAAEVN